MKNAIGILVHREEYLNDINTVSLLQAAYLYGVEAYAYLVKEVRNYLDHGFVRAIKWDPSGIIECETDIPKYTETFYGFMFLVKPYEEEYRWVMENTIQLDEPGMQKTRLQLYMLQSDLYKYSIPTFVIRTYNELISTLPRIPNAILKPSHGNGGSGVLRIRTENGVSTYFSGNGSGTVTEAFFDEIKNKNFRRKDYHFLLEPRLNILTNDGYAADHRCVVSLNAKGEWQNVMTFGKIGNSNVMSNFTQGGSLCSSESLLTQFVPEHPESTLEEINKVAIDVAKLISEKSKGKVSFLGIDICVEREKKQIYVIEANSKPEFGIISSWPLCLVRAQYFTYVLNHPEIF